MSGKFKINGKKKSIKCWSLCDINLNYEYGCGHSLSYVKHYDYSMNRVYVKEGNSMKSIGYYCKNCGKIISDIQIKELKIEVF
ncbi:hypothetical protein LCGC14_3130790 [marine sediment metagenome]|uniref:Uncharacterized protein n=1 Tax=marine sediment metagenome TaxID=412755 RepID=A0A0F8VZQ8_9ZZZZ